MLTKKQIISEIAAIQYIVAKDFAHDAITLREALDNLRVTVQYLKLDNESLNRELEYAKKKK